MIDINLKGVFLTLKHCGRHMVAQGHGGSIIATGSVHCFTGVPGSWPLRRREARRRGALQVDGDRAGAAQDPRQLRLPDRDQLDDRPGSWPRPASRPATASGSSTPPAAGTCIDEGAPLVEAIEVTEAIMYLASDASLYVTGAPLLIDAAMTAK